MKHYLKTALLFFLYYSGIEFLLSKMVRAQAVAILMYHGICDDPPMPSWVNFHVSKHSFRKQLAALVRRYPIISLEEATERLQSGARLNKCVVLTFDDGYRNNLVAAEQLRRLQLPWTVFLSTDYIGSDDWFLLNEVYFSWARGVITEAQARELRTALRSTPRKERHELLNGIRRAEHDQSGEDSFAMLSWAEVGELANSGATIGAHTRSHCNLVVEDPASREYELRGSKEEIGARMGASPCSFAYPYGSYDTEVRNDTEMAGFRNAVTTEYGVATHGTDLYALPRVGSMEQTWRLCGELLLLFIKEAIRQRRAPLPQ